MKRFIFLISFASISACVVTDASALDTLDALLPTPYLLRSRADDLNVDESTQARIEQMYKAAEPKYHDLKNKLKGRTRQLKAVLLDGQFDTGKIARGMKTVLEAENELKRYQVHVRISLLSQVTAEQRQGARNFASEKLEEARWRGIVADGTLDALLPRPFWFRSRTDELGIDAATRKRIEQTYMALEPKYHELKKKIEPLTKRLFQALLADRLNEEAIVKRLNSLLEVETELKLHQVHVRTSLLSQVTAEQRQAARELVKSKPESDWKKVLSEKVERVRTLSKRLSDSGDSVADIETRMIEIEDTISEGSVTAGARKLDQVIRDLEERLDDAEQQQP